MSTLCRASMLLLLLVAAAPSRPAGGIAPGLPAGAAAEGASVAKPPAQGKTASLLFFYYGDSKYETLGQEALKLKKALEGHDFNVLLKHESLPSWADLSEKDEKLANIKDLPTKANFFKYLVKLAKDGYHDIDVLLFVHGSDGWFKASTGKDKSSDMVTAEDIKAELAPAKTGLPRIPIRAVWGTNCYGSTLLDAWLAVGARTAAGARFVNFTPNRYGKFIDEWNKGNVSFGDAVRSSDTAGARTVAETFLATVDAQAKKKAGTFKGCPLGKTVLGSDPCAKDYFLTWIDDHEWQAGKSGKENLVHSSTMILAGDTKIAKIPASDRCKEDSECKSTEYCDKDLLHPGRNQCVPRKADGSACNLVDGGRECQSWKCGSGHCYTPRSVAAGGACYTDDACQAGKCSAIDGFKGSCVCKSDSDCKSGEWCDGGLDLEVNACRIKLAKGVKCGTAGSLGNDHKCKSGECSGFPKYVCK